MVRQIGRVQVWALAAAPSGAGFDAEVLRTRSRGPDATPEVALQNGALPLPPRLQTTIARDAAALVVRVREG